MDVEGPTAEPSLSPSPSVSPLPSSSPSNAPTPLASATPSALPSSQPTSAPSATPTYLVDFALYQPVTTTFRTADAYKTVDGKKGTYWESVEGGYQVAFQKADVAWVTDLDSVYDLDTIDIVWQRSPSRCTIYLDDILVKASDLNGNQQFTTSFDLRGYSAKKIRVLCRAAQAEYKFDSSVAHYNYQSRVGIGIYTVNIWGGTTSLIRTIAATSEPSAAPSLSLRPSTEPTVKPTITAKPSTSNLPSRSAAPSSLPSRSAAPSSIPSVVPSTIPSNGPSSQPTRSAMPSQSPSSAPTVSPTSLVDLAEGRPARANENRGGYGPSNAVDGDSGSWWESIRDGSNSYSDKWWEVDLGSVYDINSIEISWRITPSSCQIYLDGTRKGSEFRFGSQRGKTFYISNPYKTRLNNLSGYSGKKLRITCRPSGSSSTTYYGTIHDYEPIAIFTVNVWGATTSRRSLFEISAPNVTDSAPPEVAGSEPFAGSYDSSSDTSIPITNDDPSRPPPACQELPFTFTYSINYAASAGANARKVITHFIKARDGKQTDLYDEVGDSNLEIALGAAPFVITTTEIIKICSDDSVYKR